MHTVSLLFFGSGSLRRVILMTANLVDRALTYHFSVLVKILPTPAIPSIAGDREIWIVRQKEGWPRRRSFLSGHLMVQVQ
jgi:hypothetical protein